MGDLNNTVEQLVGLGSSLQTRTVNDNSAPFVVVPEGFKAESLEETLEHPLLIRQKVNLKTAASFIEYVARFGDEYSTIFADKDTRSFRAILDFHAQGESHGQHLPSWNHHTADYACPLSRDWKAWTRHDGDKKNQLHFAEFLEDRAKDIVSPSGAELLDIALKFNVTRKSVFSSGIRLSSGEVQFQFSDQNEKKDTVEVPEEFTIGLAPFHNGEAYEIKARLRYRINEGCLTIWYQLIEPEKIIEDAFAGVMKEIGEALDKMQLLEAELPE
ncbi:DUF2303 family protein [Endozoicomonas lisbonensis]|uniref:Uncharacterized protein YfdQ (DUF2303 family) n=1 Tax=Endozoicomonas lisbonensis TaxID=3120522 RepID=A0ABV2SFJ8_9GAMM